MIVADARRRLAALRQPRTAARLARALWLTWAFLAWNVVFDHVIVVAGRDYIAAAERSLVAGAAGPAPRPHFANMDDWMRPAVSRGVRTASAAAGAIAATGLLLVHSFARAPRADR